MPVPNVSVIIPSALRNAPDGELWLLRAVRSVLAQTALPKEIIIGLDPGEHLPGGVMALATEALPILQANGSVKGHQAACNAAAERATGELLGFLEDDDTWEAHHLGAMSECLHQCGASFASTSQLQVDPEGKAGEPFDFPTASGWLMKREAWQPFDPRWRIHHDNEFLSRLNAAKVSRIHVVEATADIANRKQLTLIAKNARVVQAMDLPRLTVNRTVHASSIMGGMDEARYRRSMMEYAALTVLYGEVGW